MPIFKYTVANRDGKKLNGTVEASDEKTARIELNNLGFSILSLKETTEAPKVDKNNIIFIFEAVDKNSKLITGTIPAKTEDEAFKKLQTEYALTVTAIWKKDATPEEIEAAKKRGTKNLQEILLEETKIKEEEVLKEEKKEQFTKTKIEYILKEVNALLKDLDKELDAAKKTEINKKINKLLRIKHSKNTQYILATAEDLLKYIQDLEKSLKEKGYQEKRIELQMKSKKLLTELNKTPKPESLSEDVVKKIEGWERTQGKKKQNVITEFINSILLKIKDFFTTPEQIMVIKQQIKAYNRQLIEFIKLYIKEPTPDYKEKVKNSIKTIWETRKKTIHSLKQAKKLIKERKKAEKEKEVSESTTFTEELNTLTGWLLSFYMISYFISLYITTKDFGLSSIPKGFFVYNSHLFKYVLTILFLLHSTTALKVNFFKKNIIANIVLPIIFVFGSIVVILNF